MTEYRPLLIPANMLIDCPIPAWEGGNWLNLAEVAERRRVALVKCNDRWAAVRDFQEKARIRF